MTGECFFSSDIDENHRSDHAEMDKVGDISLLFYLAGANFWANLGNFGSFLGHFGSFQSHFG